MLSSFASTEMNEQTEVGIVEPPEVPHDTRICIEDLVDTDIDESDIDELRDEQEVQGENMDIRHAELVHRQMECADESIGIQVGNVCCELFSTRTWHSI